MFGCVQLTRTRCVMWQPTCLPLRSASMSTRGAVTQPAMPSTVVTRQLCTTTAAHTPISRQTRGLRWTSAFLWRSPAFSLPTATLWVCENTDDKSSPKWCVWGHLTSVHLIWSSYVIGQTIYIFMLWFVLLFFPRLISAAADCMSAILPHMVWPLCEFKTQVWNLLHAARWKQDAKKSPKTPSGHHPTTLSGYVCATKARIDNRKKTCLSSDMSSTYPHNMVNFGPLAAEIGTVVWGTPANFNRFRVLAALLHGTVVVVVSQTLRRWTDGATYILQGSHHVGHWPTFLVWTVTAQAYINNLYIKWFYRDSQKLTHCQTQNPYSICRI